MDPSNKNNTEQNSLPQNPNPINHPNEEEEKKTSEANPQPQNQLQPQNQAQNQPSQTENLRNPIRIGRSSYIMFRDIYNNIGSGAFGEVFYGIHEDRPNELLAVKVISKIRCKPKMFEREVEVMRRLNHPNVIKFFYSHESVFEYFLVFEYCPLGSLDSYIKIQPNMCLDEEEALDIVRQIVSVMVYCLESPTEKIVHRDLKPGNVLLHETGIIKVIDFGLARLLKDEEDPTPCGTPIYMSPEFLKKQSYSYQGDVWSLGVMLYELLVGRVPWIGWEKWKVNWQLLSYINHWSLENDQGFKNLNVGPEIRHILRRTLVHDPAQRATFEELAKYLSDLDSPQLYPEQLQPTNERDGRSNLKTIEESKNENMTTTIEDLTNPMNDDIGLRRFRLTFQSNADAVREFGKVDNCRCSGSMRFTTNLMQSESQTPDVFIEESAEEVVQFQETTLTLGEMSLEEPKESPAKTRDMEEEKVETNPKKVLNVQEIEKIKENAEKIKKIEEGLSFRLNQIYFLRKLINNLLLLWRTLEGSIGVKPMDMVELLGGLLRLQVLLSKALKKEFDEQSETIFINAPNLIACYAPILRNNLEAAVRIYGAFCKDCEGLNIDSYFFSEIGENSDDLTICEKKIQRFIKLYANQWWEIGRDRSDAKILLLLKQLLIGRNREELDRYFRRAEGSGNYVVGFYEMEKENKNPQLADLIKFISEQITKGI